MLQKEAAACKYCLLQGGRSLSLFPSVLFLSLLPLLLDPCPVPTLPLLPFFPSFLLISSVHLSASRSPTTWCYSMTAEWSRFYAKTNLVLWQVSSIAKPQCKYWSNLEKEKNTHWQRQLCTLKSESQTGEPFRILLSAHCPTGLQSGDMGSWSTCSKKKKNYGLV